MCFSATASFTASVVIGAVGVATLTEVKDKKELPLAFLPMLFAIQQLSEGILWLSNQGSCTSTITTYVFLFFALVLWPTYAPLSIFLVEKDKAKKKMMKIFLGIGIAVSLYFAIYLFLTPKTFIIDNLSIRYILNTPYTPFLFFLYIIATCATPIYSSSKWIRFFGYSIIISLILALATYSKTTISVWCFYSAIISATIYLHFRSVYPPKHDIKPALRSKSKQ